MIDKPIKFIGFKKDKIIIDLMRIISIEETDVNNVEIQLEGLKEPVIINNYTLEEITDTINNALT